MNVQWLLRHPRTRLITGFALHLLSSIAMMSIMAISLGLITSSLSIAGIILYTAIDRIIEIRKRNLKDTTTTRNNSVFENGKGAELKSLINKLSGKLGITPPPLEHDQKEFAMAQTWPYQRKILVNEGMFREPEEVRKAVVAHELAHIYQNDQIKLELSCFAQLLLIRGFFISSIFLLVTASPLLFGTLLCVCMSQVAAGIIVRATETQADLTGCELLEDPNISYNAFSLQKNDEKPVYDSYKSYFNSWLAPHPSDWERKEDIVIQYPSRIKGLI